MKPSIRKNNKFITYWNNVISFIKKNLSPLPLWINIINKDTSISRARDLKKKSGKYDSGLRCRWALFTAWASYFPQSWVEKNGLIFYLADFHGRNGRIPDFKIAGLRFRIKLTSIWLSWARSLTANWFRWTSFKKLLLSASFLKMLIINEGLIYET